MPLIASDAACWLERRWRAMGSTVHVIAGDARPDLADWAVAEVERLEACWSRFRANSELARLHTRSGRWTEASAPMLLALTTAADLHVATAGRFDPTIRDALERAGYDRTFEAVAPGEDVGRSPLLRPAPGFTRVDIDCDRARVRIPRGVRVDLGGLGKGLAADLVARGLVARGARCALVGVGGDLCARGDAPDGGWPIPVEHPLDERRTAFTHSLFSGGLVTSTTRIRTWRRDGRAYHHLVDPATGDSTRSDVVAVVAAAADASWAEGVAKAIVVAGSHAAPQLAHATGVHAWCATATGELVEVGA